MSYGYGDGAYGSGPYGGGADSVTPPPPPLDAGQRAATPVPWRWALGRWNGLPDAELTAASDRKITFSLLEPSKASFSMNGDSDEALYVADLNSDLWVYRGNEAIYRGRVTGTGDDIGETRYNLSVDTVDYRGLLDQRILYADQTHRGQTPELIVDYLIELTQGRRSTDLSAGIVGGNWGIFWYGGHGPITGVTHDLIEFKAGDTVRQCIDSLAQMREGGFEWDIDSNKKLHLYYPRRSGVDNGATLDLGGTITAAQGRTDGTGYANAIRQSGGAPQNQYTSTSTYPGTSTTAITRLPDAFTSGMYAGSELKITKGKGAGQVRAVSTTASVVQADGNNHMVITVTAAWSTIPDTTSEIQIPRTPDPVNLQNLDSADTPGGRFDIALGDTSLITQGQVTARGNWNLEEYGTLRSSWTLTFAPGGWQGVNHVWLGDVVTYAIKRGRRYDVRQARVYEISISLDENDHETVSVVVEKPHDNDAKIIKRWGRRTAYLSIS